MSNKKIFLPYKAITASRKEVNFKFSLDENTNSPLVINEIINLLLSKISNEINIIIEEVLNIYRDKNLKFYINRN